MNKKLFIQWHLETKIYLPEKNISGRKEREKLFATLS
jgi:hypothetical protein